MYEWIVDVRHKLLMSEYVVLLATFIAIQLVGIDGGIGLGIAVAIFDFVRTTAIVSNVNRVSRRSSALFSPRERSYIENHIYSIQFPKIITLECRGSVFFGSSMQFLSSVLEEIGVQVSIEEKTEITMVNDPSSSSRINSVRIPPSLSPASIAIGTPGGTPKIRRLKDLRKERANGDQPDIKSNRITLCAPPRFLVLDLALVANVDASAARGCFLQLARICARRNISVCATGCNSHIDWILQTHGAAHHVDVDGLASGSATSNEKIILFNDLHEGE
jgi:MFS superfamily sulfate permease-like transporter